MEGVGFRPAVAGTRKIDEIVSSADPFLWVLRNDNALAVETKVRRHKKLSTACWRAVNAYAGQEWASDNYLVVALQSTTTAVITWKDNDAWRAVESAGDDAFIAAGIPVLAKRLGWVR